MVFAHPREVHLIVIPKGIAAISGRLLSFEEVVLLHLTCQVQDGLLQAAIAGAEHAAAHKAGHEDSLPRVGEYEVIVKAVGQPEVMATQEVAALVNMTLNDEGTSHIGKPVIEDGRHPSHRAPPPTT